MQTLNPDILRTSLSYTNAHRNKTFVIHLNEETILSDNFHFIAKDISLLSCLEVKVVITFGITTVQKHINKESFEENIQKLHSLRTLIESQFMSKLGIGPYEPDFSAKTASGNWITAKPQGVIEGQDMGHAGKVRKINIQAIQALLEKQFITLIPSIGYSPLGETFLVNPNKLSTKLCITLNADKFILFSDKVETLKKIQKSTSTTPQAITNQLKETPTLYSAIKPAIDSAKNGVRRSHILDSNTPSSLLHELFTPDGNGLQISLYPYEQIREATIDDIPFILQLIKPYEDALLLIPRTAKNIEQQVSDFFLAELDGRITGCVALHIDDKQHTAELACLATDTHFRTGQYPTAISLGDALLNHVIQKAQKHTVKEIFVLTTQTMDWFKERRFIEVPLKELPKQHYKPNLEKRNPKLLVRKIKQ